MNPTDRSRLEASALEYAMAVRAAMSDYRRSGKMRIVESDHTMYTITRGSPPSPSAAVRTAEQYVFGGWTTREHLCRTTRWDVHDRILFMLSWKTAERGYDTLLQNVQACTAGDSLKAEIFISQILERILYPSGTALPRPRVKAIVRLLTSVLLGEPTSWSLEAEINGVWPEGASVRLAPVAAMRQVWSVTYRDDVDAVERRFDMAMEALPDAKILMKGRGVASDGLERQLHALLLVLTLFGPNRIRLVRFGRSELGKTSLASAMVAPGRHADSGGRYSIGKSRAASCRRFVRCVLPVLDGTSGELPEGSMQRIGVATLSLYDEGLRNHPDTMGAIAFKIVSLESMFLTDEETAEVSYKLRVRVAAALSMLTGLDSAQVLADVGTAYCIRSGFFHGHVRPNVGKKATKELDDRIGDYCRISIAAFLQSGKDGRKQFLSDLDDAMVDLQCRTRLQQKLRRRRFSFPLTAAERERHL